MAPGGTPVCPVPEGPEYLQSFACSSVRPHASVPFLSARPDDLPAALPEADRREALALAAPPQHHLVAVLQEAPLLARREGERPRAAPRPLDEARPAVLRSARDRPRRDQVAGPEVAPV